MAKVDVVDWNRVKVGQIELPEEVFNIEVKKGLLHEVVKWQLASRRQGTHMTKTKGLVSGGGKKPFKQKGTGNARQGSSRSPLMPGGGTTFGPQPRSYTFAMPKKMRKLGLSMALSHLFKEGKIIIVDSMVSSGKTKELASASKKLGIKKAILIDVSANEKMVRASRNNKNLKYMAAEGVNVYDLLKFDLAVLSKDSVSKVVAKCDLECKR